MVRGGRVLGSMIAPSTVLHENIMVSYSRLLSVMISRYFFFICFRVLDTVESSHSMQC
jgi:hypothetical protein